MDPFSLIGAAISAGGFVSSLFGGDDEAEAQARKLKQEQAIVGQMNDVSGRISAISKQQENIRKQAATSDYLGSVRGTIRNAQVARASALAAAVNGGTQRSSGLLGGQGQISGQAGDQIASVTGDYIAGQQIFGLNNQITDLQTNYNKLNSNLSLVSQGQINSPLSSIGSALTGLGNSIVGNSDKLTNTFAGVKNLFSGL